MNINTLKELHDLCIYNKQELTKKPQFCICFQCMEKFHSPQIREWTDEGKSAICPKCGVDSVLPIDYLVQEMNKYWFQPMKEETKE